MEAVPAATPVARPVAETVATVVSELVQVTWELMSPVVPSEYVPVAVSCCVAPTATLAGDAGVTAIDAKATAVVVGGGVVDVVSVGAGVVVVTGLVAAGVVVVEELEQAASASRANPAVMTPKRIILERVCDFVGVNLLSVLCTPSYFLTPSAA